MSELEEVLLAQIKEAGLPLPQREFHFAKQEMRRNWRADFAYPSYFLIIEVEGGVWGRRSRHTSKAGYAADLEKYNAAAMLGYTVLRYDSKMVKKGTAIEQIKQKIEEIMRSSEKSTNSS